MHRNNEKVDALVSIKFDASNIVGQREYDVWCYSLTVLIQIENMNHEQKRGKHVMIIAT
jgi:hypothetical protein